ncbi:hypothetical protein B9Z55_003592 [Caenorhabditis nigoni]|uniref:PAN-3 domain-containing protein n=1 Tax=Caenorhabditis nigoni TaxID=1611254 RepID=A0A2G5VRL9_9PELO|nr:hypothetical protein B9Z55_003592 [Caenorhabditis nigoni]
MRYRQLVLLLTIFLVEANASDAEYKFVVVSGEPVTLNASETAQVASFDECTDKCEQKTECVLAYQSNSSDPCYLFDWNSITQIIKNEAGGNGTTAFKVYTDQPCELDAEYLLNGKTYPQNPNDSTKNLWKIDTAEEGWTITYIDKKPSEDLICGNFSHDRPYKDGCKPECLITMVQLLAVPGPLTDQFNDPYHAGTNVSNWNECLYYCHGNPNCLVVYFNPDSTPICRWWSIDRIFFLNKTEASEMGGQHMALKLPLSNKSCLYTTEELTNDKYYYPYNKIFQFYDKSFFLVRTTPKYYKISVYQDETVDYNGRGAGCEPNNQISVMYNMDKNRNNLPDPNPILCNRIKKAPGITADAAKEICNEWDGELATERFFGYFNPCTVTKAQLLCDANESYGWQYGISCRGTPKMWVGVRKNNVTQQFQWPRPDWASTTNAQIFTCKQMYKKEDKGGPWFMNKLEYTWAPGQPDNSPGNDCGYVQIDQDILNWPGYGLYSSKCDVGGIQGFVCQTLRQQDKGIPKFSEILNEYGQDPAKVLQHPYFIQTAYDPV